MVIWAELFFSFFPWTGTKERASPTTTSAASDLTGRNKEQANHKTQVRQAIGQDKSKQEECESSVPIPILL